MRLRIAFIGIHAMLATVSITRTIAYAPFGGGPHSSPGPDFISANGELIVIVWLLWLYSSVSLVVDMIRGRASTGVPFTAVLLTVWGLIYLGPIIFQQPGSAWMTLFLYVGMGGAWIFAWVWAWEMMKRLRNAQLRHLKKMTGEMRNVRRDDDGAIH